MCCKHNQFFKVPGFFSLCNIIMFIPHLPLQYIKCEEMGYREKQVKRHNFIVPFGIFASYAMKFRLNQYSNNGEVP